MAYALWKNEIRLRIMKNLEEVLHDARLAYLRKVSETSFTTIEAREKLFAEYNQELQTLRNIAEEEVMAEIRRGQHERKLGTVEFGDPDQAFVQEQIAIMNVIRNQAPNQVCEPAAKEYAGSCAVDVGYQPTPSSSNTPFHFVSQQFECAVERDARLRRENHTQQQEEYRKRAEEILKRKKREREEREERECTSQVTFTETMSCSSSSSSNTSATSDQDKLEGHPSMSEEEVINLMIFHDQRWNWISSVPLLQWIDFPWPCLSFSAPKKEDLTSEAIGEYVQAQFNIHRDRTIVKEHLKNLIRRWHPDRFEIKYLSRIADLYERDMVRDGAGIVARILNDLLGKWNTH